MSEDRNPEFADIDRAPKAAPPAADDASAQYNPENASVDHAASDQFTFKESAKYDPGSVQVYRDAAHIRQRPGMYIGDTSSRGLHHLVYELVYNSVDEALAGHCKTIHVKINVDGSVSVADDGRGIPVEIHPEQGVPTLQVVLTVTGAGAKFDKNTYKVSAGLHGIGAKAVTALSEWVEAEVQRNGRFYVQEFERGKAVSDVKELGPAKRTGTRITFKPDPQVFRDATFDYDALEGRLRELAFLNKGLAIKLTDERTGKEETFHYAGGIAEFVQYLNRSEEPLHKPVYFDKTVEVPRAGEVEHVRVEVALQWTTGEEERVRAYANNAFNPVGGTHLSGLRGAVTRTLNVYGTKENLFKNVSPSGEDYREGLTAIVSVQVPEPQFESQTKVRLNNPEVEGCVISVVNEHLAKYLEENPKDAQKIMKKVVLAAEAREAAAKAKKALKDRKSILSGGGLPGKLMDCTRDGDDTELFLVEGQSAGGSAESGRDRMYQAILPLRGKVLNVEKVRPERVLSNEEICNLISAVGVDIGNSEDVSKVRYGKIVILTDADVDGQHIRTLLLTFFFRQMRKLVEEGHLYVARPPLYKVTQKKNVRYVQSKEEIEQELLSRGLSNSKLTLLAAEGTGRSAETVVEGERLAALVKGLGELERYLQTLERRGINLGVFLAKSGPRGLPSYRALLSGQEVWFHTADEVDEFRRAKEQQLGRELAVTDDSPGQPSANGNGNGHGESAGPSLFVQMLHEVKHVNRGLEKLKEFGLGSADLVPAPRLAGREPPPRFLLTNGDSRHNLPHLRELTPEVLKIGERGLTVVRFKGLGEMDGEELWDTTLDPKRRTLLRVQLEDASKADELFRDLMGEKVDPRREFINKHALQVKDIDYHGA